MSAIDFKQMRADIRTIAEERDDAQARLQSLQAALKEEIDGRRELATEQTEDRDRVHAEDGQLAGVYASCAAFNTTFADRLQAILTASERER